MTWKLPLLLATLSLISSCVHQTTDPTENKPSAAVVEQSEIRTFPPNGLSQNRADYSATGKNGMVTAAHPLASEAGAAVLRQGGNAIDAAVAVSFVISVVRPQSTGIGGGGFLLYKPSSGDVQSFDFRETAPAGASRDMYLDKAGNPKDFVHQGQTVPKASVNGHLSAGVPGLVAGLWDIHQKHGSLPWPTLVEPAIAIAAKGFEVYPNLAKAIDRRADVMKVFAGTRAIYFPKGQALQAGDKLVQKDLADTLRAIAAKGKQAFYQGPIAAMIAKEMQSHGGLITAQDLEDYKMITRQPTVGSFADLTVYSMPPPSSGGIHIVQMLNILSHFDRNDYGFYSSDYLNILLETMRYAYADRAIHLGDPAFYKVPSKALTSKAYAKHIATQIKPGQAGDSEKVGPSDLTPYESPSTTHFSIVDSGGRAVASTQTVNYTFGSGVVVPGTGILLNDEMDDFSIKPATPNAFGLIGYEANKIEAGKRMLSSMSPTIVLKNGKLAAVLGSPGGSRIINATLQVILNRFRFQLSPADSVHAYRVHHQWKPDQVYFEENGILGPTQDKLKAMGYQLESSSWPIGDVQAVFRAEATGEWIGVSDTRSDGRPVGY